MGEVSRSWLILKMDLMGFADGSDVDVRCFVDGVDGAALISDAGLRDGGAQHGHVVCEIPRSPPCGDIEGHLDPESGAQGRPRLETGLWVTGA